IRYFHVTGVQTCALPISRRRRSSRSPATQGLARPAAGPSRRSGSGARRVAPRGDGGDAARRIENRSRHQGRGFAETNLRKEEGRSEERRVGIEGKDRATR